MFFRQKLSTLSDEQLILAFRESEESHYVGELFSRYAPMVYGVCLKYLRDRDESKDMAMHVFEKLPETIRKHGITNFKGWLYTITRNECLMLIRSKKKKLTTEITDYVVETALDVHLSDESETEIDLLRMERCLEELSREQQRCVRSFFLDELSYKEIASQTGSSLNQVKSYIQNGRRNLKICMEENG